MNDKPVKISHSKTQLYMECSQKYKYIYVDNIQPMSKAASLYFGTAIDLAIQEYLKDSKSNFYKVFEDNWKIAHDYEKSIELYDSLEVDYSYKDFDEDLFQKEDVEESERSKKELLPYVEGTYLDAMEYVTNRKKQRAYVQFSDNEHRFFNRLSWLSMNRKGLIMIKSFVDEIGPKINKVLMIQKKVQLKNDVNDVLTGYVDMVLDLKYEGVVILDLKTAAQRYEQLETLTSQQLGIYASILGPEVNSYKVGYVVLLKNIKKDRKKICKSCGHKGEGSHKKCDALVNGSRCNGEWDIQLDLRGEVQLITEELTDSNMQAILDTVSSVNHVIKEEIFYRNPASCFNYGGCPFFSYCWKSDKSGLIFPKK